MRRISKRPLRMRPLPRTKVHRKTLLFFLENPGSVDTPRGVSAWINESLAAVRKSLEDLVRSGFLRAHRTSSTVAYSCMLGAKESAHLAARLKS